MTHANDADLVRAGAWMLGSAAVLMAGAFIAEPIRFFALASYMLAALGLMVLAWTAPEAPWVRDRPWLRRIWASVMLLVGTAGVAVAVIAVASAVSLLVSGQDMWGNVLGWLMVYSPIVGGATSMLVPGWRLVKIDRRASRTACRTDRT